jgi:hypothetical protein
MKKKALLTTVILTILLILAAAGVSTARADEVVTSDAIAGTWYGNMHFSGANPVQRIELTIPAGCEPGSVCGTLRNYPVRCTWEIIYDGFSSGAYQYHFSNTLKGSCPAGSAGSLTLLADGSLYRVHTTPMFTATGTLSQRPSALK